MREKEKGGPTRGKEKGKEKGVGRPLPWQVPVLLQSLEQSEEVADRVLPTLAALGTAAAAALPAPRQLLASPDACALHHRARLTLEQIRRP